MDRGAWQAAVHGVARVGHDLATKERERQTLQARATSALLPAPLGIGDKLAAPRMLSLMCQDSESGASVLATRSAGGAKRARETCCGGGDTVYPCPLTWPRPGSVLSLNLSFNY